MFGRGKTQKSAAHHYIMAMGRKAGNLKPPPKTPPKPVAKEKK
jgi:hypothetical protein